MSIQLKDTVIYGKSAGGYLSVIMGIYLKGASVVADNAQFDLPNWIYKEVLDDLIVFCFDEPDALQKYKERFNVVDAFEKNNYVPKLYIHVNLCSYADNLTQLIPLLERMESMKNVSKYNGIHVILYYEPQKGHNGLSFESVVEFLYKVLGVD